MHAQTHAQTHTRCRAIAIKPGIDQSSKNSGNKFFIGTAAVILFFLRKHGINILFVSCESLMFTITIG